WMMILVVFEDRKVSLPLLAPAAAQIGLDAFGVYSHGGPLNAAFVARDIISVALAAHALSLVIRGWRGDLVEDRRRLRGPFLAFVARDVIVQHLLQRANLNWCAC